MLKRFSRPQVTCALNAPANTLLGTFSNPGGSVSGQTVGIALDGAATPAGTAVTAPDGSWSFPLPFYAGTHTVQAAVGAASAPPLSVALNPGGPWTATAGIDISALGFAGGVQNNYTPAAFDKALPAAKAAARLAAGNDFVRICVDPSPMMAAIAAGSSPNLTAAIAVWQYGLNKVLGYGLKAIVDIHVGGGTGETVWTIANIQNDYPAYAAGGAPASNKWAAYLQMIAAAAAVVKTYPAGQVAFELWNETTIKPGGTTPNGGSLAVSALAAAGTTATATVASTAGLAAGQSVTIAGATPSGYNGLVAIASIASATTFTYAVAAGLASPATGTLTAAPAFYWPAMAATIWTAARAVAPATTLLVSGANYAGVDGLQELTAASFDANPSFLVHSYDPQTFTYQGYSGGPTPHVSRLHYPGTRSDQAAATASLSGAELGYVNGYFNTGVAGTDGTYLDNYVFGPVAAWCTAQGVAASRIVVTEVGCKGDVKQSASDIVGPSLTARAMWYQDWTTRARAKGYAFSWWLDDVGITNIFDISAPVSSMIPDPAVFAAMGRTVPRIQFDKEASDFIARLSVLPSNKRNTHINAVFRLLKDMGALPVLDGMWCLSMLNTAAGYPKADAMLNWFPRPPVLSFAGNPTCIENGTGTWTDGAGYASDGSTGYLDTGLVPGVTAGSVAVQNNAAILLHQSGLNTVDNAAFAFGNSSLAVCAKTGGLYGGVFRSAGLGTTGATLPYTDEVVGLARFDAAGDYAYTRGSVAFSGTTQVAESAKPSSAPLTGTVSFGRVSSGNYAKPSCQMRSGMVVGGAGLTSHAQIRDLSTALAFAHQGWALMV